MTKYEPDENLLWVNHKKAAIEPRRRNLGKDITESLSTIDVDGTAITSKKIWYRGVLKRKVDNKKCYPIFEKYEGCGICLKVCPIGRFGYDTGMEQYEKDGTIPKKTR